LKIEDCFYILLRTFAVMLGEFVFQETEDFGSRKEVEVVAILPASPILAASTNDNAAWVQGPDELNSFERCPSGR
jgi:hypothetical protein